MANFTFTANGQTYKVTAPAGTSEAAAKAIFDKQLNTGSLTGLSPGQFVNAAKQAEQGLKSAIAQLGPNADAAIKSLSTQLPNLSNVAMPSTTNIANFVKQSTSQIKIGTLNPTQIQGLVSQAATQVGQAAAALTSDKGLGKFGFNPKQLEQVGVLKPGTAKLIESTGKSITDVLRSPTVWTGKNGINNVTNLLSNEKLQNTLQQNIMKQGFDKLGQIGAITKDLDPSKLGPIVQNAAKFGADTAKKWLDGAAPAGLVSQLNSFAKGASFAGAFAALNSAFSGGGSPLQAGIKELKGFANTINRDTVNQGTKSVIGNPKVPQPSFSAPPKIPRETKESLSAQLITLQAEKTELDNEYSTLYSRFVSAFQNGQVDRLGPAIITDLRALKIKYEAFLPKIKAISDQAEAQAIVDLFEQAYRAVGSVENNILLIDVIINKIQARIDAIKAESSG